MELRPLPARLLIRIDWIAGASVGVLVLSLRDWLAQLYSLPSELVLGMGLANLAYASGSFTLAMRTRGDRVPYLRVIAVANGAWALVCLGLVLVWWDRASALGIGQLIAEALFVGGLGHLEWRADHGPAPSEPFPAHEDRSRSP
jgi:hypothetical protein